MPLEQLPETFAIETTLELDGREWIVASAEPPTAAEFAETGRLTLKLRLVQRMSPHEILYSLPSICDSLPPFEIAPAGLVGPVFRIHEDDWRQVELVSRSLASVVDEEIASIRRIFETAGAPGEPHTAFREIHVRRLIPEPIERRPSLRHLTATLPPFATAFQGVGPFDQDARARGGFAFEVAGWMLYGIQEEGLIGVLGLQPTEATQVDRRGDVAASLAQLMADWDLSLVDWCRCAVVPAEEAPVAAYLSDDAKP